MRGFDYRQAPVKLLTPDIVRLLAVIHEHKGKQELFIEAHKDDLKTLLEMAKIQSTGASNRIEGIYTSDSRLRELMQRKVEPRNRSEREITGYREVLFAIHESYEYIVPRPNTILQLHRDLYHFDTSASGGVYKNSDNAITEIEFDGKERLRFVPVPAYQTPDAMDKLCDTFLKAWGDDHWDRLLLIPMFILDFLCIHPFSDGNGRMSRLLSLLLLYKAGYIVGKYISIEERIEKTKESYYEALQASSLEWHEGKNSYEPFVTYFLRILVGAYSDFEDRVSHLKYRKMSKPGRIKAVLEATFGKITKKEIMDRCPDISQVTVERTLTQLVKEGSIIKIGAGPASAYVFKRDSA